MAEYSVIETSVQQLDRYPWYQSRGFQYGDGIFETALCTSEGVRFAQAHAERLTEGLALLHLQNPLPVSPSSYFETHIPKLLQGASARLKLMVWRKGGGTYTPETTESEYLLLAMPYAEHHLPVAQAHVVHSVYNSVQPASTVKTISSLHYILAALERAPFEGSMPLLATSAGVLSEGLQAGIVYFKNGEWYRPTPFTGCIEGVVARQLDALLVKPEHVQWTTDHLNEDTTMILANASGVRHVMRIGNQPLNQHTEAVEELRALLF